MTGEGQAPRGGGRRGGAAGAARPPAGRGRDRGAPGGAEGSPLFPYGRLVAVPGGLGARLDQNPRLCAALAPKFAPPPRSPEKLQAAGGGRCGAAVTVRGDGCVTLRCAALLRSALPAGLCGC